MSTVLVSFLRVNTILYVFSHSLLPLPSPPSCLPFGQHCQSTLPRPMLKWILIQSLLGLLSLTGSAKFNDRLFSSWRPSLSNSLPIKSHGEFLLGLLPLPFLIDSSILSTAPLTLNFALHRPKLSVWLTRHCQYNEAQLYYFILGRTSEGNRFLCINFSYCISVYVCVLSEDHLFKNILSDYESVPIENLCTVSFSGVYENF